MRHNHLNRDLVRHPTVWVAVTVLMLLILTWLLLRPAGAGVLGADTPADFIETLSAVLYVDDAGHVHELTLKDSWQDSDLTAAAGAPFSTSNVRGYTRQDGETAVIYTHASYGSWVIELQLELMWDGSSVRESWTWNNLSYEAGAPAPDSSFAPFGYVRSDEVSVVVYKDTDDHIIELRLEDTWLYSDLTAIAGAPLAATEPVAYVRGDGISAVIYSGTDGHIHEIWLGTTWQWADLTALALSPFSDVNANPFGYVRGDGVNTVVYKGSDDHINELWLDGSWQYANLTAAASAPASNGPPWGYVRADGTSAIVYGGDPPFYHDRILELRLDGSWGFSDLTSSLTLETCSDPAGYVRSDGLSAVVYRHDDASGFRIHELSYDVGWLWTDLFEAAGIDSIEASSPPSPWPYNRRQVPSCVAHCDCPQGWFCYYGECLSDPTMPVYCCNNEGCPPGRWCFKSDGTKGTCSEDINYFCENACDCGPAHCCNDNICVKDVDDPWFSGGIEVGPSCEQGVDATYCCEDPLCHAGRMSWDTIGDAGLFRCYNEQDGTENNYCSGKKCYGTACGCSPGESCIDIYGDAPIGKTCFLLEGGTCVSNAVAEAVYGFSPAELLPCGYFGVFPGQIAEWGWQTSGSYAYQRVVGPADYCGNGTCDPGEYPGTCIEDCHFGDGMCAPSELGVWPADCGICGDLTCQEWESPFTCPNDCRPNQGGDGRCDLDEIWSSTDDCSCPDSPYFSGIYAACGDDYHLADFALNPETCETCALELSTCLANASHLNSPGVIGQPILFSRRYGGSVGPKAPYFAPDFSRCIFLKNGYLYVTGQTYSKDFATTSSYNHGWDAFAMKLETQGDLVFSRYLGLDSGLSHDNDTGRDITVDEAGYLYVTGSMGVVRISPDGSEVYTYTNAIFDSEGGYGIALDSSNAIYVTGSEAMGAIKLNGDGSLAYQTSSLWGVGNDIAVDEAGNAYVAGVMGVVKLDPTGTALFTTTLNANTQAIALAHGLVYVAGYTFSDALPVTSGAIDINHDPKGEAVVAVMDTDGNVLYATYLGGDAHYERVMDIGVDDVGYIYIAGFTYSSDFPTTADAIYPTMHGFGDAFLAVIDPTKTGTAGLLYSTYFGGNDPAVPPYVMPDRAFGMALDSENGHVYLTGEAGSADFPTTDGSTLAGFTDIFVTKLDLFEDVAAEFSAIPVIGTTPLQVSFTDESTGDKEYYWWSFGDGEFSEEANPIHIYTEPGIYAVTLTVRGLGGIGTETKVGYITVLEAWRLYLPLILGGGRR